MTHQMQVPFAGGRQWVAWTVAMLWLWLGLCVAPAWAAPVFPQLTDRVVDQANLLDPAARDTLIAQLKELEEKSSYQLVVVTVPDLQGFDVADYTHQLARQWKIGQAGKNTGVVLLVAPTERKVRIEVGYGLEGVLPDAIARTIIERAIVPRFKANDMAGGIVAGVKALTEVFEGDKDNWTPKPATPQQDSLSSGVMIFWFILLALFILSSVSRQMWLHGALPNQTSRGRMRWVDYLAWLAMMNSSGRGGGDWGGGSWGGGGGFSGGGGSFGGGGASGSW